MTTAGKYEETGAEEPSPTRVVLAWLVHLYTGMGLVLAGMMAFLIFRGDAASFRMAFVMMLIACLVDGTDGTMARKVDVKRVLPGFDGRRLDDIIDFLTYTFMPLLLVWRAGMLPTGWEWVLFFPLLASIYGFCQTEAKTEDGYFLGFPSLWNVVVLYLYYLGVPPWGTLTILVLFGVMTFVPSVYLYPTQGGPLNWWASILAAVWVVVLIPAFAMTPVNAGPGEVTGLPMALWLASTFYPAFYMGTSWFISMKRKASETEPALMD